MKKIFFHTCEDMHEVKSDSARLAFASPPYTNNRDGKTLDKQDYLSFIMKTYSEIFRTLTPGGVLVSLNTDLRDHASYNKGETKYEGTVWHKHHSIREVCDGIGYKCFDHKIWVKSFEQNLYRYNFSHIMLYSKPGGKILRPHSPKHADGFGTDVWHLQDSMMRKDSKGFLFRDAIHPEILRRCIDEFTKEGDLVVSPFAGSGTVLAVAEEMGRDWAGYEVNKKLETLIKESIYGPKPKIYSEKK
ncbi:site-specific DNA-methyltransferase [Candidatus Woesearchaeota archaeon]|nr:site-specific DNA-methyltransferase [Candidatus Woesearchaeota archaeon]